MQTTPYLFFNGDCFEAMSLYAEVLGGEVFGVMRNADAERPEDRMPGPDDAVMNMAVKTAEGMIMASDSPSEWYRAPQGFRLHVEAPSSEDYARMLEILSRDAKSVDMPDTDTFWAERFTMFTDRFGTPWMLSFTGARAA